MEENKANFLQVTPFLHVEDLEKAVSFFRDLLGFNRIWRDGNYAYVEREGVGFRMLEQDDEHPAPKGTRAFAYYVDVRDVDALYTELKPKLDTLPAGDVHGPENKLYGQRELLVLAPDGNLIAFGQGIFRSPGLVTEH